MVNKPTTIGGFSVNLIKGRTFKDRLDHNDIIKKLVALPLVLVILLSVVGLYQSQVQPLIDNHTPIVTDVHYEPILVTPKRIILRISGIKGLPAKFIEHSETGEVLSEGLWHEAKFSFLEDDTPGSSRVASDAPVSLGKWEWKGKVKKVTAVRATMRHFGNPIVSEVLIDGKLYESTTGKIRETIFGPFAVEPYGYESSYTKK